MKKFDVDVTSLTTRELNSLLKDVDRIIEAMNPLLYPILSVSMQDRLDDAENCRDAVRTELKKRQKYEDFFK